MELLDIHVAVGIPPAELSLTHSQTPTDWYYGGESIDPKGPNSGAIDWLINKKTKQLWIVAHTGKNYPLYLTVAIFSGPDVLRVMKAAYQDQIDFDITAASAYQRLTKEGYTLSKEGDLPEVL